jgi:hypothetical protein
MIYTPLELLLAYEWVEMSTGQQKSPGNRPGLDQRA